MFRRLLCYSALVLLCAVCASAQSKEYTFAVSANGKPPSVGQLYVQLDSQSVALVPGVFQISFTAGQSHNVDIFSEQGHHYVFAIRRDGDLLSIGSQHTASCQKAKAVGQLVNSPQRVELNLTFHIDNRDCSQSAATGPPDGRIKIRFDTDPTGGTLHISGAEPLSVAALPKVLSLAYWKGITFSIFFQKVGYFDCAKQLRLEKQANTYFLVDGSTRIQVTPGEQVPEPQVPQVSCPLRGLP